MIISKISKSVGIFYRLRRIIPFNVLHNLYYSFVYPYLLNCVPMWGGTVILCASSFKNITKKVVLLVAGEHYLAHTNPLFVRLEILKLDDVYKFKILCHMFNRADCISRLRDSPNSSRYPILTVPYYQRFKTAQRSLHYACPHISNLLPPQIGNIAKFTSLNVRLDLSKY